MKKKGGKRGRRIGTHHRQTTVSRDRAMRHGHYQNETENTRIRRKARRKKNRSPSPPITSSPTSYQGKTSPVAAINSDSNRKASKYHWGHMNLKEQLRQANLGKDPPFMPSGNASAPDFSIYSVTQRRLGNSKAYGEPDNESSAKKAHVPAIVVHHHLLTHLKLKKQDYLHHHKLLLLICMVENQMVVHFDKVNHHH